MSLKMHLRKQGFSIYLKAIPFPYFFLCSGIYATKNTIFPSSTIPLGFPISWVAQCQPQPRGQFYLTISLLFLPFAIYILNQIVMISASPS